MKISVIGAGNVGATAAQRIAEKELGDVVLIDISEGTAVGKALDIQQSASVENFSSSITGTSDFKKLTGSKIVVVTAGFPRKPGMSRSDLISKNMEVIKDVSLKIKEYAPNAFIIMVTNPLDIMTYVALNVSGFNPKKVIGMAGLLDSARYISFIAEEANVSIKDIQAMVLGGHGDSMVPVVEHTTIGGIPITQFLSNEVIENLVDRTRNGGAEIVGHLKTGSAFYSPSSCAVEMVKAIIKDSKRVITASVYLEKEYGYHDICLGVPVIIGKNGIEKIIELPLSSETKTALDKSAQIVRDGIKVIREKI